MEFQKISPGLFQLSLGMVNCFLLETSAGHMLIDTGMPEHGEVILKALNGQPLTAILLTHCHPDHAGGAAFLHSQTGAPVWVHHLDAPLVISGQCLRPLSPAPGRFNRLLFDKFVKGGLQEIPPCPVTETFPPGELMPIHTPGHCLGHVAFYWPSREVMVMGDVAANVGWLRPGPAYEDFELGLESLQQLGNYHFQTAVFGHGSPILKKADRRFRRRFGRHTDFRHSQSVQCRPERLWEITTSVAEWPSFLPTFTSLKQIDEGPLGLGHRVRIKQPGQLAAVWEVTRWEPPFLFEWVCKKSLLVMTATHRIVDEGDHCQNHLQLRLEGALAGFTATVLGTIFSKALEIENQGFKERAESQSVPHNER